MHLIMWISEHKCIVKVISLIPAWNFEIFFSCSFIHFLATVRSAHVSKVQVDESWENNLRLAQPKAFFASWKILGREQLFFHGNE